MKTSEFFLESLDKAAVQQHDRSDRSALRPLSHPCGSFSGGRYIVEVHWELK